MEIDRQGRLAKRDKAFSFFVLKIPLVQKMREEILIDAALSCQERQLPSVLLQEGNCAQM